METVGLGMIAVSGIWEAGLVARWRRGADGQVGFVGVDVGHDVSGWICKCWGGVRVGEFKEVWESESKSKEESVKDGTKYPRRQIIKKRNEDEE